MTEERIEFFEMHLLFDAAIHDIELLESIMQSNQQGVDNFQGWILIAGDIIKSSEEESVVI